MEKRGAFGGAKTAMMFLDIFANMVAQEIGMERTLNLTAKAGEKMGEMQGTMMKQQIGAKEIDAKTAWSLLKTTPEQLGLNFQIIEESPKRVVVKAGRCSIYEAAQALGIDNKSIETMCKFSSNRFDDSLVKQLNPRLNFRVRKFRSSADDFCEEEITLE